MAESEANASDETLPVSTSLGRLQTILANVTKSNLNLKKLMARILYITSEARQNFETTFESLEKNKQKENNINNILKYL